MKPSRMKMLIPALATLAAAAVAAQQAPATRPAPGAAADGARPPMIIEQPNKSRQAFSFAAQRKADKTEVGISSVQSEGRYTMQDELWPADFNVPAHFHNRHSELFYVVAGNVEWTVNGETHVMGPGDMVFIPPHTPHAVKTVGGKEAHMLMLYEPGGYEEDALRESMFTAEARKDPKIAETLRKLGDFHMTTMPAAAK